MFPTDTLSPDGQWFQKFRTSTDFQHLQERPIVYFCAEFALMEKWPNYAGGLGILAGDYISESADQQIPVVGVSLYYKEGFTSKELSKAGEVVETHETMPTEVAEITLVTNESSEPVQITLPIGDNKVVVQAWLWQRGSTKIYFLDTDLEKNDPKDRNITKKLYVMDKETRLKQEFIMGVGGLRFLEALKIHPSEYHLNEGHCGFLVFELIHHEMLERKIEFAQARTIAKEKILFSNHTLVAAGNDVFSDDLVALVFQKYAEELQVPVKTLVDLGLVQESSSFSMTMLGLRSAGVINAVSKLHQEKAAEIWHDHPMIAITNGIHIPTWDKVGDTEQIWSKHQENKRALLQLIEQETQEKWDENTILLGWARRIVQYKRPLAVIERLKWFCEIAKASDQPIRLVYSGLAHPADEDGTRTLEELQYRLSNDLKGIAVYLPNYNKELSKVLTAGCDMWVNTPVVGFEACGTSGMKAALNGSLPLTTKDGWIHEIEMYQVGWLLDDANVTNDILEKLVNEILPIYYQRNEQNIPEAWIMMMKNARNLIVNNFSMTRALHEYLEKGMNLKLNAK
ncbi:hypothetical protein BH10PAT2_BH10PAT2_1620 [soil metagenome]